MRYLSGAPYLPCMHWQYGGLMFTPEMRNTPDLRGVVWAADNGCYTSGERFSMDTYIAFLSRWQQQGQCLFAVAPDVPFNMRATLARSMPHMETLRALGYPAALAIQNGVEDFSLEWERFDAVFIAGDVPFKTSWIAYQIIQQAKHQKKHVHIARRNSLKALQAAYDMGADTVDGTYLKFGPDCNWHKMQIWFRRLNRYDVNIWTGLPRGTHTEQEATA